MADEPTNKDEQPEAPQEKEEQPAVAEEAAPEVKEETPAEPESKEVGTEAEAPEQPQEKTSEEINMDDYWRDRYPAPRQNDDRSMVDEVTRELSQLPTDEAGTVDANAAAEWFARKLSDVESRSGQAAARHAEQAAMAVVSESAQQQQLLKQYPELSKDREALDAVFDLRDAATLRGKNVSLLEAASKLDKLRQQGHAEGKQAATRRTTVQAAAHLETAANKGSTEGAPADLSDKASRHEMLKQFVTKGIESGEIQVPGN